VLSESFGRGSIAVAVFDLTFEMDVARTGGFFFESAQVGTKGFVGNDADFSIFEGGSEAKGELFFNWGSDFDAVSFPAESVAGLFVELSANCVRIHATAFELRQREDLRANVGLTRRCFLS
jgi:hypothetical protein